jgi:VCBS repeat-containing protein
MVITITDAPLTGGSTVTQTLKILSNDPTRAEVDIRVTGNSP